MAHAYKVGDRVRRTGVALTKDVGLGELGEVAMLAAGGRVEVNWARSGLVLYDRGDARLEPADPAPAAAVPTVDHGPCPRCGKPAVSSAVVNGHRITGCPCVPVGQLYAYGGVSREQAEAPARGSQQAQDERWVQRQYGIVDVDTLKAELAKAKEVAVYWKKQADDLAKQGDDGMRLGDLKGERDKLRSRCSELETEAAYWRREAIRLKGGRR